MKFDNEIFGRAACSDEEKKQCAGVIEMICNLSEQARTAGLLSLESEVSVLQDPYLKKGVKLIIDGTDPDIVREIFYNTVRSSPLTGVELLKVMIMFEGVERIQQGLNPENIREILSSYVGMATLDDGLSAGGNVAVEIELPGGDKTLTQEQPDEALQPVEQLVETGAAGNEADTIASTVFNLLPRRIKTETIKEIVRSGKPVKDVFRRAIREALKVYDEKLVEWDDGAVSSGNRFDLAVALLNNTGRLESDFVIDELTGTEPAMAEVILGKRFAFEDILKLDDRSIQRLLRHVDSSDLAKALKGAGPDVHEAIFRNMSARAGGMLKEDMQYMGPIRKADVEEAQAKIVNTLRKLEEMGEIVLSRGKDDPVIE